jgi:hypothetical protein
VKQSPKFNPAGWPLPFPELPVGADGKDGLIGSEGDDLDCEIGEKPVELLWGSGPERAAITMAVFLHRRAH